MTEPNFFQDLHPADQVRALSGLIFDHVRRYYDPADRTDDLVREAVDVLEWLRVYAVYTDEYPNLPDKHLIRFANSGFAGYWSAIVDIESHRGGDVSLKYRVTLGPEDPEARYFESVDDFMPVFVGISYFAKTRPGRPVKWSDIATVVDYVGSSEPIGPWAWGFLPKVGA